MNGSQKSRYSIIGVVIVVVLLVFAGTTDIFSNHQPSFKSWQAKIIKSCIKLNEQNNAAFMKIFSSDHDPTIAEFIAFEKYYEPDFEAFEIYLKSLDRPAEQESKIDEFISAVEGYRINLQKSSANLAAAQTEFAAGGQTPAGMRLGIASSALGLEKCV